MAERKFDYSTAKQTYGDMQTTTTEISDALGKANSAIANNVQVEGEAIYGDLGAKLLLDWENSSSSFPTFIDKFGTWATLIAQSSGNYSQFEDEVKGFNSSNPLGPTSNGMQSSPIITSDYTQYYNDNYQDYVDNGGTGVIDPTVMPVTTPGEGKDDGSTDGTGTPSDNESGDGTLGGVGISSGGKDQQVTFKIGDKEYSIDVHVGEDGTITVEPIILDSPGNAGNN